MCQGNETISGMMPSYEASKTLLISSVTKTEEEEEGTKKDMRWQRPPDSGHDSRHTYHPGRELFFGGDTLFYLALPAFRIFPSVRQPGIWLLRTVAAQYLTTR